MGKRELKGHLSRAAEMMKTGNTVWQRAIDLFNPGKTEESLRDSLKNADLRLALWTYAGGGMLIFIFAVATTILSVELANFASDTLSEVTGQPPPHVDYSAVLKIAGYQFVLYGILGLLMNLLHEALAFGLAKVTGGKGTLAGHLSVSSSVWLAVAISMLSSLLAPFPCLGLVGLIALVGISIIYLMVYMHMRAYSIIHDITLAHSAVIVLLLILPRIGLWIFATEQLAGALDLSGLLGGV